MSNNNGNNNDNKNDNDMSEYDGIYLILFIIVSYNIYFCK